MKQEYRYSPKRGKRIGNMVKSRDMGLSIKDMLGKVITEQNTKTPEELSWAATEMSMAKNILIREHGFLRLNFFLGRNQNCLGKSKKKVKRAPYFSVGEKGQVSSTQHCLTPKGNKSTTWKKK